MKQILENMAHPQNDTAEDQLAMLRSRQRPSACHLWQGVRFFDFRLGYCVLDSVSGSPGVHHSPLLSSRKPDPATHSKVDHQHAIVPGKSQIIFLIYVHSFLCENPTEIVFLRCALP